MGFKPVALRKAKIVCNFGLSECNRVNIPKRSVMQRQTANVSITCSEPLLVAHERYFYHAFAAKLPLITSMIT